MRGNPVIHGVIAGGIAASATAGALVAMGRRLGSARLAFGVIGGSFGGARAGFATVSSGAVVGGIVAHITIVALWGIVFALLVERWNGHTLRAALLVSVIALALSSFVARAFGRGLATLLPLGDRIVLAVVLALALVVGMRLALPQRESI